MVFEKIKELLASQLGISAADITETTDIADDLGADSLDVVELIMAIEEEFQIEVDDTDAGDFRTVGDVAGYIQSKL